jgi:hypothetical protein
MGVWMNKINKNKSKEKKIKDESKLTLFLKKYLFLFIGIIIIILTLSFKTMYIIDNYDPNRYEFDFDYKDEGTLWLHCEILYNQFDNFEVQWQIINSNTQSMESWGDFVDRDELFEKSHTSSNKINYAFSDLCTLNDAQNISLEFNIESPDNYSEMDEFRNNLVDRFYTEFNELKFEYKAAIWALDYHASPYENWCRDNGDGGYILKILWYNDVTDPPITETLATIFLWGSILMLIGIIVGPIIEKFKVTQRKKRVSYVEEDDEEETEINNKIKKK